MKENERDKLFAAMINEIIIVTKWCSIEFGFDNNNLQGMSDSESVHRAPESLERDKNPSPRFPRFSENERTSKI